MRLTLRAVLLALPLALLTATAALADNGGVSPVESHSPNADAIRTDYWLVIAFAIAIFVIVEGLLVVFIIRFRRGRRARTLDGPQIRGNTNLEIAWTVVPVLIVAAILAFVFVTLPDIEDVPPASAAEQVNVLVDAHQYYWLFTYPGGKVSIDTMVVPENEVVRLTVVASDVVHGWWVPSLGGQIDAIPGRVNHTWFRVNKTGTFEGRCTQFCGMFHTFMHTTVRVVSRSEYRRFLATHAPGSSTVAEETFVGVCSKCHGPNGEGGYGPPLQNRTFAKADITDLLRNGRGKMPAVGSDWSQAQIDGVIRYLQRTKGGAQSGG